MTNKEYFSEYLKAAPTPWCNLILKRIFMENEIKLTGRYIQNPYFEDREVWETEGGGTAHTGLGGVDPLPGAHSFASWAQMKGATIRYSQQLVVKNFYND